jgi:hypothetical protein
VLDARRSAHCHEAIAPRVVVVTDRGARRLDHEAMALQRKISLFVALLVTVLLALPALASATTMTVNSSADALTGAACTLREAILASNTRAAVGGCPAGNGDDTIAIAVPQVTLALAGADEDADATGDLDITGHVAIRAASGSATVDAAHLDRVLDVLPGAMVTLQDLTVTGGSTPAGANGTGSTNTQNGVLQAGAGADGESGGGIRNAGTLVLRRVTVTGNATGHGGNGATLSATAGFAGVGGIGGAGGNGAGIATSGTLTATDVTVTHNDTGVGGAGGDGIGAPGSPASPAGFIGDGGNGGRGGVGAGVYDSAKSTIVDSTISDNRTGAGSTGGIGRGGAGLSVSSGSGGAGGHSFGGSGGNGGNGGGLVVDHGTMDISGSLIFENGTGPGGPGAIALGGPGGNGAIVDMGDGPGGAGGAGTGGPGGEPGTGGGIAVGTTMGRTLVATSDTIAQNTTGLDGDAAQGVGGPGGRSRAATGGDGGEGTGGGALDGETAGGVAGSISADTVELVGDTVVHNRSFNPAVAATGIGGIGGFGVTDGQNGASMRGNVFGLLLGAVSGASVADSIVTDNEPQQCSNVDVTDGPQGGNVSFPDTGCPGVVADPKLGPLADNGGPTLTYAPQAGSPAIDEVPKSAAPCSATDQRGVSRPQGAACDAGAYEIAPPTVSPATATVTTNAATIAGSVDPNQRATTVHLVFGPTAAHDSRTDDLTIVAGTASVPVSFPLVGLSPGTTYHYAVVATNADGTTTGSDQTFTTATPAVPGGPRSGSAIRPLLSRLALTPSAFRPRNTKRRTGGTTIAYSDTMAARTTFTVERKAAGVRAGTRCVAPPKHAGVHRPKACTRYVLLAGSFSHADRAGRTTLRWSGTLRGRALTPGTYRLLARASVAGVAGATVEHAFTIKRA